MNGLIGSSAVGDVVVHATNQRGHSPEELVDMALDKIIKISGEMPPPIRDQVNAFKDRLKAVLIFYMTQAAQSERTTFIAKVEGMGHQDLANILRSM